MVIENPYRSFFWHLPEITSILQDDRAVLVRCDFCMFGGKRLKKTALLANDQIIHALAVQCDGQHEHLPWGVVDGEFATKQETAYTNVFCRTFMLALTRHLRERGFKDEREVQSCLGQATATAKVLTTKAHTKRAASFRMLPGIQTDAAVDSVASSKRAGLQANVDASGSDPGVESSDSGRDQSVSRLRESYGRLAGCVLVSSGVRSAGPKGRTPIPHAPWHPTCIEAGHRQDC